MKGVSASIGSDGVNLLKKAKEVGRDLKHVRPMPNKNSQISRRLATDATSLLYTIVITPSAGSQVSNLETYSAKKNTDHHVRPLSNNDVLILKSDGLELQEKRLDSKTRVRPTEPKDRSIVDVRSEMRRATAKAGRKATSDDKLSFSDQGF